MNNTVEVKTIIERSFSEEKPVDFFNEYTAERKMHCYWKMQYKSNMVGSIILLVWSKHMIAMATTSPAKNTR